MNEVIDLSDTIARVRCRVDILKYLSPAGLPFSPLLGRWLDPFQRASLTPEEYGQLAEELIGMCRDAYKNACQEPDLNR